MTEDRILSHDLIPGNLSEEVRIRWSNLALTSTWFMGLILGFKDLTPILHLQMSNWITSPSSRKLGLVPRDHLKTSIWTIADTVRLITKDPLERILLINEVADNAYNFLYRIRLVAESNALWRWLFPSRIPNTDGRWRYDALEFPRDEHFPEASVEAIGVGGASTSRHYTRIKHDDLIGKEAADSNIVMNRAIDQYKLAEHLLVNRDVNPLEIYGTRWAPNDVYEWVMSNEPNLDIFFRSCYSDDGSPIWPERFSARGLQEIETKNGVYLFGLQMKNEVIGIGQTEFQQDWLQYYTTTTVNGQLLLHLQLTPTTTRTWSLEDCYTFQGTDPNFSPESTSARTAIIVLALTPDEPFNVVILECHARAQDPLDTIRKNYEFYLQYKPITCGIETVAGQIAFYSWLRSEYPEMPVAKFKTDAWVSKLRRIRTNLSGLAKQGRIFITRTMTNLIEEWIRFPRGRTVDLLDVLAYMPQIWVSPPKPLSDDEILLLEEDRLYGSTTTNGRNPYTGY